MHQLLCKIWSNECIPDHRKLSVAARYNIFFLNNTKAYNFVLQIMNIKENVNLLINQI